MELANNALPIYRQGIEFRNVRVDRYPSTTKCEKAFEELSACVTKNKLNILHHDTVRATCKTDDWHTECLGAHRRNHIEILYRKGVSQRLYNQDQLNKYMEAKNHNSHYGLIDPRY